MLFAAFSFGSWDLTCTGRHSTGSGSTTKSFCDNSSLFFGSCLIFTRCCCLRGGQYTSAFCVGTLLLHQLDSSPFADEEGPGMLRMRCVRHFLFPLIAWLAGIVIFGGRGSEV